MRPVSYDYVEIKEMIYGSLNLKGAVYESKQNSESLQVQVLQTLPDFYKVHSLSSEQIFNRIE